MSDPHTPVLATMASMWLSPSENATGHTPGRNRKVRAADVYHALVARFGEARVREEVTSFLENTCAAYENAQIPDTTERSLADCTLNLVTEEKALEVSAALASRIVRSFPPVIWHFPIGLLIARYLGFQALVETLLEGITRPPHAAALEDALTGFRLYLGKARHEGEQRANAPVVQQALVRLNQLASSDDTEIARLARNARSALENHAGVPS